MNFEQHDNLLLADWVFEGSILSSRADKEVKALETLVEQCYELAASGAIEAVLWIQKVHCSDFDPIWLEDISENVLRDEVRWRLAQLYRIRRAIQDSPVPWFYLSEKNCLGTFSELAFACHRRFVFDTETWFGFPEISAGQLPALGWMAQQLQRKPKLLEVWQRQTILKAEEAVQFGLLDAALSWKDWRLVLLPWAQRQVEAWEHETRQRGPLPAKPVPLQHLWVDRHVASPVRSHIQSYTARSNRQREAQAGLDLELIDSAAHFMCQAPYELWVRRSLTQKDEHFLRKSLEMVYLEISESTLPLSILSRLLDAGIRVCFFAEKAESLRKNLEMTLGQIESRYHKQALQLFGNKLSWYVGKSPRYPLYPTLTYGSFRDIKYQHKEIEIKGWAHGAQSMERQVVEISEHQAPLASHLQPFFQAVYSVKAPSPAVPLLYLTRSLAFQALLYFCRDTGESLPQVLEQLRSLDWHLLGSERHWKRFLDYRLSLMTLSHLSIPDNIGRFEFDRRCLQINDWKSAVEWGAQKRGSNFRRGPGWLHNYFSSFAHDLSHELVNSGFLSTWEEADLYLADALAYPESWGSPALYARRMGRRRLFHRELSAEL